MTRKITMLGTGHAMVTKCYNTCFTISEHFAHKEHKSENSNSAGEQHFLVDAGGGNGILTQMERANISFANIHEMFLTHAHTDHLLGAVWVVRKIATMMQNQKYDGEFYLYCHDEAAHILRAFCEMTLIQKHKCFIDDRIHIRVVEDGEKVMLGNKEITFFNIGSNKTKQFGFQLLWEDGMRLVCLGDEPYRETSERYAKDADWLMSEAYCLYEEREIFQPYEKHHSTALDAGKLAAGLNVKNLLLYHTEDKNLEKRKVSYVKEAKEHYKGNVIVPDDLEVICLK